MMPEIHGLARAFVDSAQNDVGIFGQKILVCPGKYAGANKNVISMLSEPLW